jgi:hypothetical protein
VTTKHDIFEAYENAAEGLAAWANIDPDGWSAFVDTAAERRYDTERAAWRRSLVRSVLAESVRSDHGQAKLFEPPESGARIEVREVIVAEGHEHPLFDLAGAEGARLIRVAMTRDLKPALTTIKRCKNGFALADHIEAESSRLGRDVAVREVIAMGEAA